MHTARATKVRLAIPGEGEVGGENFPENHNVYRKNESRTFQTSTQHSHAYVS